MTDVDEYFNYFLQRDIAFYLDDKIIKKGKLALITQKDYYYVFNIYIDGILRKIEYPYPFLVERIDNGLLFNYHLTSLGIGNDDLYYRYLSLNKNGNSKLYDKILKFEVVDNLK